MYGDRFKNNTAPIILIIENRRIEQVHKYTYLGSTINEHWDHSVKIKCRIEKARAAFNKLGPILKEHHLNIEMKMRLVRCYVFAVPLYGVESWTLTEASSKKIQSFEMCVYRRILRISWVEHVPTRGF